jgi:hypothetical protein
MFSDKSILIKCERHSQKSYKKIPQNKDKMLVLESKLARMPSKPLPKILFEIKHSSHKTFYIYHNIVVQWQQAALIKVPFCVQLYPTHWWCNGVHKRFCFIIIIIRICLKRHHHDCDKTP